MIIRGFILIFDATPMSQMAGHYIIMWRMVILRKSEGGQPCNIPILELPVVCVVEPDKKQHFQSMIIRGYILTFGAIPMSQMAGHDINMWRKVILGSEGNHIISLSLNSLDCVQQSQIKKQHFQSMIIRGFILFFDATPMSQMAGHYITMWRTLIHRKSEGNPIN